jgi:hypothetical protein
MMKSMQRILKWSLIRGLVFLFPINASSQRISPFSIGGPASQTRPPISASPDQTGGIQFPEIQPFPNPQSFGLALQPLDLLSNRMALPQFHSHLDLEGRFGLAEITAGRLTLETLPFALDPIAARTSARGAVRFPLPRRRPYPELFLSRLQPLRLLSNRLFLPKFNSLLGRAGLFPLQRTDNSRATVQPFALDPIFSAKEQFYRPPKR